jgi:hypothetical protein
LWRDRTKEKKKREKIKCLSKSSTILTKSYKKASLNPFLDQGKIIYFATIPLSSRPIMKLSQWKKPDKKFSTINTFPYNLHKYKNINKFSKLRD